MDELEKQLSEKQREMEKLGAEIKNLEQRKIEQLRGEIDKLEQIPVTRKEFEEFKSEIRSLMANVVVESNRVASKDNPNPLAYSNKSWFTHFPPYNYSVDDYGESTFIAQYEKF